MKRTKLIASLMMCVFCLSFLVVGVWATVTSVNFNLNGNLQFYPEGVYVELSGQVYRGSSSDSLTALTYDPRFTLEPKGKYNISVCLGTACFVKGSQAILDRLKDRLKIEEGKTTEDGKFSIDTTRCVGACGIAPVFTVNDEVYGHATVKKLDEVLDELEK